MACGMPLPPALGKTVIASQAQSVKPSGVMMSGSRNAHSPDEVAAKKRCWARSAAHAKPTLIRPTAIAPIQKTALGLHTRHEPQTTRERRSIFSFL